MSAQPVNYEVEIEDPTFEFGNSSIIFAQIKAALVKETTDIANSNFLNINSGSTPQVINRPIIFMDPDGVNDLEDDPSKVIASKDWVKQTMKGLSYSTTGRVVFKHRLVLDASAAIVCSPNNEYIEPSELKHLQGVSNNIQTQLNDRVNNWQSNQPIWGTKLFNTNPVFQDTSTRPKIINSALATDTDITTRGDVNTLISGKQNTINSTTDLSFRNLTATGTVTIPNNAISISKVSGLQTAIDAKQPLVTNLAPIAENCVTNLVTDLSARPTLTQLQDGTLELAISKLTVDNIVATSQTISYQEMDISNNAIPQVKITNLVSDLGALNTTLTNLSTLVDTKASSSDVTTSLSGKQNTVTSGSLSISHTSGLQAALDTKAAASDVTTSLSGKQDTIADGDLSISHTSGLQAALDAKAVASDMTTALAGKQNTIANGDLTIARTSGLQAALDAKAVASEVTTALASKQDTVTSGSLSISHTSGLQAALDAKAVAADVTTALAGKQDTIADGDLSISKVSGLQAALDNASGNLFTLTGSDIAYTAGSTTVSDLVVNTSISIPDSSIAKSKITSLSSDLTTLNNSIDTLNTAVGNKVSTSDFNTQIALKQDTITNGSLTIARTSGLQAALDAKAVASDVTTALAGKQDTITDASLTIARTSGLQAALDSKVEASDVTTAVAGKQDTITDASLTIARTSGLQAALDAKQANITDASLTIARTSGLQAALDAKQATLTSGSVSDAMLASTFLKPNTAISVTSLDCTSATDSGNLTAGSISEKFTNIGNNGTANSYTLNYTSNTSCYILTTAPTANFTVRLDNCGTDTSKSISFTVVYATTGKWYANSVSAYSNTSSAITLASSTPLFLGGTPSIATSTVMIQSFTLVRNFASNYVLSSVASYF